jgi:hypothetical protein
MNDADRAAMDVHGWLCSLAALGPRSPAVDTRELEASAAGAA